jgi:hypothetical protein
LIDDDILVDTMLRQDFQAAKETVRSNDVAVAKARKSKDQLRDITKMMFIDHAKDMLGRATTARPLKAMAPSVRA